MGSTGGGVHLSGTDRFVLLPFLHFLVNGVIIVDWMLRETLHIHAELLMLSDLETTTGARLRVDQQVLHLLVVNLEHGDFNLEPAVIICQLLDSGEDFIAGDGHNSNVLAITNLNNKK